MQRSLVSALLVAVATAACGAPDVTTTLAPLPTANLDFPKPYVVAGEWQATEFVPLPGAVQRVPTLDAALVQVRTYFLAGIRTPGPDTGVTILQTGTDASTRTVSLLVTQIGGANSAVAGRQERVVLHQDDRGWWMDPMGQDRVYCLKPLGGFGGNLCTD